MVVGALLAPLSVGYIERYTRVGTSSAYGRDVAAFLLRQPGFEDGDRPVAFASRGVLAPLAGDRFSHELRLVPARIRCDELARLADRRRPRCDPPPVFFGASSGWSPTTPPPGAHGAPAGVRDVVSLGVPPHGGRRPGRPRTMTTLHRRRPGAVRAAAALVYAALVVLFVSPALLPGKTLSSSDTLWFEPPWLSPSRPS